MKGSSLKRSRLLRRLAIIACNAIAFFYSKPIFGLDQNGDGLNDLWQQQYSVPSTDADLDYTGNGLTNRQKSLFRAVYVGDIDADGDGLTAWEENSLGTDDNNPDTDHDGIPDAWEYVHGLNALANDANADSDADGATNLQEYQAGTDPNDYYNGVAPILVIVSGDNQTGRANSFLANPLIVKITNSGNQPLGNAPVTFGVAEGGGELSTSLLGTPLSSTITVRTGSDGTATVYFKLPSNPASDMSIDVSAGMAATAFAAHYAAISPISIISGDQQEGLPGKMLPLPLVVRLVDASGEPIASSAITFSVANGNGTFVVQPFDPTPSASITLTTNQEGLAWVYYIQGTTNGVTSSIA